MTRRMSKSPADRVKATRIRRKIEEDDATDDEIAWLETYESTDADGVMRDMPIGGKSASERITYTEERAAAEGDHPHPDAYAAMTTAEGLRADTLMRITTQALITCNEQYRLMADICLQRTIAIENAHVSMLEAIRDERLARIDAEGEARMAQVAADMADGDKEMETMLKMAMQAWALRSQGAQTAPAKKGKVGSQKRAKVKKERPLGSID